MRNGHVAVLYMTGFCLGLFLGSRSSAQIEHSLSASEVLAKLLENENGIKDVQASFSGVIIERNFLNYQYEWGYAGGKEFLRGAEYYTATEEPTDNTVHRTTNIATTFDGERMYFWRHDLDHIAAGLPSRGAVRSLDGSAFKDVVTPNVLMGFFAHEKGRLSCGEAISQAKSYSLNREMQTIDGHACYVVEALGVEYDPEVPTMGWDVKVWIDPQRGFRPLKIEKYHAIEGQNRWVALNQRVDNIVLREIDGTWFPVEGISRFFRVKNLDPPPGMSLNEFDALSPEERTRIGVFEIVSSPLARIIQVDPASVKINSGIPQESFVVKFPVGCRVYDEFAQTGYVVGGKGLLDKAVLTPPDGSIEDGNVPGNHEDRAVGKKDGGLERELLQPPDDPRNAHGTVAPALGQPRHTTWVLVVSILVGSGVCFWFWRMKRKMR